MNHDDERAAREQKPLFRRPLPPAPLALTTTEGKPTRIFGIASGKGGVGKSTVSANLAVALAETGTRVGLIDLDIYGFSQGRLFGATEPVTLNEDEKIVPWHHYGVWLVSMGMFVDEDQPIIWRGPMLGKMMDQFFQDVAWPDLDLLLVDLPPGTGDMALNVAQRLPNAQLVLVTSPQPLATHVARRAAEVARKTGQPIFGVIENMSYFNCPHGERLPVFGTGGGQQLAEELGVPLLGQIPLDPQIRQGGDQGRPTASSESPTFQAIAEAMRRAAES